MLVLAALLATVLGARAPGGRKPADQLWTRADSQSCYVRGIIVLPPVGETKEGVLALEDRWLRRVHEDGRVWLRSTMVMDHFSRHPREGEALLARVHDQIKDSGEVDSATATRIARALGADAVLAMRIDRWDRDGYEHSVTHVDVTLALEDSSGHLLWRISGGEVVTARFGVPTGKTGVLLPRTGDACLAGSTPVTAFRAPGGRWAPVAGSQGGGYVLASSSSRDSPRPGTTPAPGTNLPPPRPTPTYVPPTPNGSPLGEDGLERGLRRQYQYDIPPSRGALSFGGGLAPDFELALKRLLDRWVPLFPKARGTAAAHSS